MRSWSEHVLSVSFHSPDSFRGDFSLYPLDNSVFSEAQASHATMPTALPLVLSSGVGVLGFSDKASSEALTPG